MNKENKDRSKQIVRIINKDLFGHIQLCTALSKIQGIGYSFSNAVCNVLEFPKTKKIGTLEKEEIKKIEDVIKNPEKYKIPSYIFNRRKDMETGKDKHIITSDLKLTKEFDIKRLRKIKCYRGMRHSWGLPVRGQKTKGHFRKGKSMGVKKKKK